MNVLFIVGGLGLVDVGLVKIASPTLRSSRDQHITQYRMKLCALTDTGCWGANAICDDSGNDGRAFQ